MTQHQIAPVSQAHYGQPSLAKALVGLVLHLRYFGAPYIPALGIYIAGRWQWVVTRAGAVAGSSRRSSLIKDVRGTLSYYELLGVPVDATPEEVKTAYRILAKNCHPDLNTTDPSAAQRFARISKAYHVLINSELRCLYDAYLRRRGSRRIRLGFQPAAAATMLVSGGLTAAVSFLAITYWEGRTPNSPAVPPATAASTGQTAQTTTMPFDEGQGLPSASNVLPGVLPVRDARLTRTSDQTGLTSQGGRSANRSNAAGKRAAASRCSGQRSRSGAWEKGAAGRRKSCR